MSKRRRCLYFGTIKDHAFYSHRHRLAVAVERPLDARGPIDQTNVEVLAAMHFIDDVLHRPEPY